MIISPGRRYIFVHIPKTGGTSLATALEARAMKDDILIGDTPKAVRRRGRLKGLAAPGRLWKHSRLADIDGVVAFDDMLIFALVRNPWDRMVSYYHWLRVQGFEHPAVELAKTLSFASFLDHPQTRHAAERDRAVDYVTDASGVQHPAHFVRLEHLTEDFTPVEAHLGFELGPIAHLNRSERPNGYRAAYDVQSRDLVAQLYSDDIQRFNYVF